MTNSPYDVLRTISVNHRDLADLVGQPLGVAAAVDAVLTELAALKARLRGGYINDARAIIEQKIIETVVARYERLERYRLATDDFTREECLTAVACLDFILNAITTDYLEDRHDEDGGHAADDMGGTLRRGPGPDPGWFKDH